MLAFPGFTSALIDSLLDDDLAVQPMNRRDRTHAQRQLCRPNRGFPFATPTIKNNKYSLALDLHQFAPEEVKVQFDDNKMLRVSGRHEQKSEDGSCYELREYVHHFTVPDTVQHDKLSVKLDKNGLLNVEGPLKVPEKAVEDGVRSIPIEFIGKQS